MGTINLKVEERPRGYWLGFWLPVGVTCLSISLAVLLLTGETPHEGATPLRSSAAWSAGESKRPPAADREHLRAGPLKRATSKRSDSPRRRKRPRPPQPSTFQKAHTARQRSVSPLEQRDAIEIARKRAAEEREEEEEEEHRSPPNAFERKPQPPPPHRQRSALAQPITSRLSVATKAAQAAINSQRSASSEQMPSPEQEIPSREAPRRHDARSQPPTISSEDNAAMGGAPSTE